jgi:hypothetical protein
MLRRLIATLFATLIAGCIIVPAATGATKHSTEAETTSKSALAMLSAVKGIRVGLNSTTVTIQNGAKAHPIVIDYGEALQTGALNVNNDGSTSRLAQGGSATASPLPKSLSVGQIAAWLLGLTLLSRVIGIVRQVLPHRA